MRTGSKEGRACPHWQARPGIRWESLGARWQPLHSGPQVSMPAYLTEQKLVLGEATLKSSQPWTVEPARAAGAFLPRSAARPSALLSGSA